MKRASNPPVIRDGQIVRPMTMSRIEVGQVYVVGDFDPYGREPLRLAKVVRKGRVYREPFPQVIKSLVMVSYLFHDDEEAQGWANHPKSLAAEVDLPPEEFVTSLYPDRLWPLPLGVT